MLNNKDELMANLNEEAYKIWAYERRVKALKEDLVAYTEMQNRRIKSLQNRAAFKRDNLVGNMKSLGILKLAGKIPVTLSPLRDEKVVVIKIPDFELPLNWEEDEYWEFQTRVVPRKKNMLKGIKAGKTIEGVVIETKDRLRIG